MLSNWTQEYLKSHKAAVDSITPEVFARIISRFVQAWKEDRQVFVFGNGGSAANASHFATDLGKGASDKLPRRFRVMSLNENTAWITAIGNDYSYDDVFVRQLENFARPGDLVLTMSVSGNSPNIVKAVEWANKKGLHTIGLCSAKRGKLADLAKDVLVVDSTHYGRVEDVHMHVCHMICYALMENPQLVNG